MRETFAHIRKWQAGFFTVASASVEQIRSTGYDVMEAPSASLPNHGRIVHTSGVDGFTTEHLERLFAAFTLTEDC